MHVPKRPWPFGQNPLRMRIAGGGTCTWDCPRVTSAGDVGPRTLETMPTKEQVIDALRVVEDPELGMDIVELGLLYDVEVEDSKVKATYSLTSMGCPVGPMIEQQIKETIEGMEGVAEAETELTWDPPWSPERMSEDAKFILGFGL